MFHRCRLSYSLVGAAPSCFEWLHVLLSSYMFDLCLVGSCLSWSSPRFSSILRLLLRSSPPFHLLVLSLSPRFAHFPLPPPTVPRAQAVLSRPYVLLRHPECWQPTAHFAFKKTCVCVCVSTNGVDMAIFP